MCCSVQMRETEHFSILIKIRMFSQYNTRTSKQLHFTNRTFLASLLTLSFLVVLVNMCQMFSNCFHDVTKALSAIWGVHRLPHVLHNQKMKFEWKVWSSARKHASFCQHLVSGTGPAPISAWGRKQRLPSCSARRSAPVRDDSAAFSPQAQLLYHRNGERGGAAHPHPVLGGLTSNSYC